MSPARALAVELLAGPLGSVAARLDRALSTQPLVAEDRALLAEIVNGTLRMRRRLAHALEPLAARGIGGLAPRVRAILESAAYQILFLERVPAYAIVNDAVELARWHGHERASGFVNAVLRALANPAARGAAEALASPVATTSPAPTSPSAAYVRSDISVRRPTEDAAPVDPIAALGVRHSYPDWIVRRAIEILGAANAELFLESGNVVPPVSLRANRLRGGRAALLARLAADGVAAEPCAHAPDGVRLAGRPFLPALGVLREGLASVQDESAMLVADLVAPAAGETIADLCASPGGKALAIAERGGAGEDGGPPLRVLAVDRPARLARLRENALRLGIAGVEIVPGDARALAPVACDAVLVDAPCSGLGVLRRHADLRWTKRDSDIARFAALQGEILDAAARWVRPGGRLIYSTCSILPDENEAVVLAFLSRHTEFRLEPIPDALAAFGAPLAGRHWGGAGRSDSGGRDVLRAWPHRHGMDGAFACRLRRPSS